MKLKIIFTLLLLSIVALMTLTPIAIWFPSGGPFHYASDDGRYFVCEVEKMHDSYSVVIKDFNGYKITNNKPDLQLERLFSFKWWQFWNWGNYLTDARWRLPFSQKPDIKNAVTFLVDNHKKILYLSVNPSLDDIDVLLRRHDRYNLTCCSPIKYDGYAQSEIKIDTLPPGDYFCVVNHKKFTIFFKKFIISSADSLSIPQ